LIIISSHSFSVVDLFYIFGVAFTIFIYIYIVLDNIRDLDGYGYIYGSNI
jgi:hypothetical protein